jgi:hypothetical protein
MVMFEFDLASLEAHDEDIRLAERERIIKLLESQLRTVQVKGYPEWTWQTNAQIIALIKGRKNG